MTSNAVGVLQAGHVSGGLSMWQVLVSLEEAAAANAHRLALVRALYDFHPQTPFDLPLRKV